MMHRTIALAVLAYFQVTAVNAQAAAAGRPSKYECPKDHGLKYTTYVTKHPATTPVYITSADISNPTIHSPPPNVVTFELKCGQGTTAKRIDNTPKNSQKECAQHCADHPQCQSADYNWSSKNCARFSEVS